MIRDQRIADGVLAESTRNDALSSSNGFNFTGLNGKSGDLRVNDGEEQWPDGVAADAIDVATLQQALRQDMQVLFHRGFGQLEDRLRDMMKQQTQELLGSGSLKQKPRKPRWADISPPNKSTTSLQVDDESPQGRETQQTRNSSSSGVPQGKNSSISDTPPSTEAHKSSLRRLGLSNMRSNYGSVAFEREESRADETRAPSRAGQKTLAKRLGSIAVVKARRLGSYANVRLNRTVGKTLGTRDGFGEQSWTSWWDSIKAAKKGVGTLAQMVDSQLFSAVCIAVILFHAVISTSETNRELENAVNGRAEVEQMNATNLCILAWYVTEVCLRIGAHRLYFFFGDDSAWNIFDFVLVCFSLIDAFLSMMLNLPIVRSFRILKVVRVLRTVRAARFFSDLRLMVVCIAYSVHTLFWCILLLFFIQYIFSMMLVQGMTSYILEENEPLEEQRVSDMLGAFGTVEESSLSLWMSVTGGQDWSVFYDIIKGTGWLQAAVFIFYIAFFVIAAFNIVTGTFVNKAFTIARPDPEMVLRARELQDREYSKKLAALFMHADVEQDGMLFKDEFMQLFEGERHALLEVLGMSNVDAGAFFDMLTDGDDLAGIDLKAFVTGILMLSGPARGIDIHIAEYKIMTQIEGMHRNLKRMSMAPAVPYRHSDL